MEAFLVALSSVWADSGFSALTGGHVIMIVVGLVLLYMAIGKGFEPLLLSPIAFGCILANIPKNGFEEPGVMSVIMYGIHHEVFPPLIFLGVGAMTDFGPLLANPKTLLLGAAAQAGVFVALLGAMMRPSGVTISPGWVGRYCCKKARKGRSPIKQIPVLSFFLALGKPISAAIRRTSVFSSPPNGNKDGASWWG